MLVIANRDGGRRPESPTGGPDLNRCRTAAAATAAMRYTWRCIDHQRHFLARDQRGRSWQSSSGGEEISARSERSPTKRATARGHVRVTNCHKRHGTPFVPPHAWTHRSGRICIAALRAKCAPIADQSRARYATARRTWRSSVLSPAIGCFSVNTLRVNPRVFRKLSKLARIHLI